MDMGRRMDIWVEIMNKRKYRVLRKSEHVSSCQPQISK